MTTDIVIASAARTPARSFNGAFANTPAHDLGTVAIKAALNRAKVAAEEVDEVGRLAGSYQSARSVNRMQHGNTAVRVRQRNIA
jgi:acetyl-CoA C-acetyltransferase